jgi:urease accessory protein
MLRATEVLPAGVWKGKPADVVRLDYDRRTRRRIALAGSGGLEFLLDLAKTPVLRAGDGIRLEDGRIVAVEAASERLLEVQCRDPRLLARIAWHLGNRHLASEIAARVIHIRDDYVIADMIRGLGAEVRIVQRPFNPEGGAYGEGAVHGHSHAHSHHHHGPGGGHHHDEDHRH